ncbi:unnamed protein product, partial [Nesidiocoris tenuis]
MAGPEKVTEVANMSEDDPRFRITPAQQMVASCTGALVTSVFVTPLDVVKIRLQAQQKMLLANKCFLYCNGLMDHLCTCAPNGAVTDPGRLAVSDIECTFGGSADAPGGRGIDSMTARLRRPEGFKGDPLFADDRSIDPLVHPSCRITPDPSDPNRHSYILHVTDFTRCGVLRRN